MALTNEIDNYQADILSRVNTIIQQWISNEYAVLLREAGLVWVTNHGIMNKVGHLDI